MTVAAVISNALMARIEKLEEENWKLREELRDPGRVQVAFYMTPEEYGALIKLADHQGLTAAKAMIQALRLYELHVLRPEGATDRKSAPPKEGENT